MKASTIGNAPAYLVPVFVVSSCNGKGERNACPVAWTGIIDSKPPMISISLMPERWTYKILHESKEFVFHIAGKENYKTVLQLGSCSGRNTDKFSKFSLEIAKGTHVNSPILADFPVSMECKVCHELQFGSHILVIGEILATHVDVRFLRNDGSIDWNKISVIFFDSIKCVMLDCNVVQVMRQ